MDETKKTSPKVKVIFCRSKFLTKVVVIAAIVLSTAALITLRWAQNDLERQNQQIRTEAAALEQKNAELEQKIDQLGSVQSVQDIAEEELGLVDPNTIFFKPE